jgi:hypothetical protein
LFGAVTAYLNSKERNTDSTFDESDKITLQKKNMRWEVFMQLSSEIQPVTKNK